MNNSTPNEVNLPQMPLSLAWFVVGFPTNLMSVAVWMQPRLRQSSGCYLAALGLNDAIVLLCLLVFKIHENEQDLLSNMGLCQAFPVIYNTVQVRCMYILSAMLTYIRSCT